MTLPSKDPAVIIQVMQEITGQNDYLFLTPADARVLLAEIVSLREALTAALHALRSYQYGNGSPDLAAEVAQFVEKALKGE